ncbi:hypothetical protein [Streptosporangium sp. KLBMP 9127]|nr:hypothetical protein [Streptosporangium sp. KLBMP 9127]
MVAPRTRQHLDTRNAILRSRTALPSSTEGRAAHTAFDLPDYEHALMDGGTW